MIKKFTEKDLAPINVEEFKISIETKSWNLIKNLIKNTQVADLARVYHELPIEHRFIFFRNIPRDLAAKFFSHLEPNDANELLSKFNDAQTKNILAELSPDDRTAIFEELPGRITKKLMQLLSPEDLDEAKKLLGYPQETVGRIMTPDYVAVKQDLKVGDAIEHIRKYGQDKETINVVYVLDDKKKLVGEFKIRSLILSENSLPIENIVSTNTIALSAFDDQETAVKALQTYDIVSLPVVDSTRILIGIVTFDDIMDIAEEEATEDIQKSSSITPLNTDYSQTGIGKLFIKRIFWLLFLLVAGFISSKVVSIFEETLSTMVVLSFFIPVLLGSGGNTGAQSTTLVIRSIATGDINISEWFKVFAKELAMGLLLGVTLSLLSLVFAYYIGQDIKLGIVVGSSMFFLILWANLIGAMLPLIITKLNYDPAVISNPLITTIVDITGLFIYFLIAIRAFNL